MSYNFKESDGRQNMWLGSNKAKYYNTKYQNSCRSVGSSFSPPLYFKNQIGLRKSRLAEKKKIGKPPLLLGQKKYLSEQVKKCFTTQKIKFSIKDFFSKYDQTRRKLRIWSHLLKESLMENLTFCAVPATVR